MGTGYREEGDPVGPARSSAVTLRMLVYGVYCLAEYPLFVWVLHLGWSKFDSVHRGAGPMIRSLPPGFTRST